MPSESRGLFPEDYPLCGCFCIIPFTVSFRPIVVPSNLGRCVDHSIHSSRLISLMPDSKAQGVTGRGVRGFNGVFSQGEL